jgi:hypothetical protein
LAEAVPAEATVVVELPPLKPLAARLGLDSLLAEWIASGALAELAKRTNIPAEGLQQLWDGFQGAALFHLGDLEAPRSGKSICLVARFGPQTPVTKALAVAGFVQRKDGRWAHPKLEELTVQWVASGGLLVASTSPADLDRVTAVMRGSGPSFATTSLFRKGLAGTIWAVADLGRLAPSGEAAPAPSTAFLQLAVSESGTMDLRLELSGAPYPRLGTVLAPAPMELVAKLPGELNGDRARGSPISWPRSVACAAPRKRWCVAPRPRCTPPPACRSPISIAPSATSSPSACTSIPRPRPR